MRKKKRKERKYRHKKPKTKSGERKSRTKSGEKKILTKQQKRKRRLRRQRQLFLEQEEFRRWKRKLSMANLLQEPVAQDAITDLWTDLLEKGPEWKEIYGDMHGPELGGNAKHGTKTTISTPASPVE